jgi:hypothetical protein
VTQQQQYQQPADSRQQYFDGGAQQQQQVDGGTVAAGGAASGGGLSGIGSYIRNGLFIISSRYTAVLLKYMYFLLTIMLTENCHSIRFQFRVRERQESGEAPGRV